MPIPTPSKGESKSKFVSRCIGKLTHIEKSMKPDQIAAICYSTWRKHTGQKLSCDACTFDIALPEKMCTE